jgi:hypothetical protein
MDPRGLNLLVLMDSDQTVVFYAPKNSVENYHNGNVGIQFGLFGSRNSTTSPCNL